MKSFYIKEFDYSFVLLNKSGSLLLLNTFYDFCYYKGYTITKNIKYGTKTFLFVRNPIERLKTSFTWFLEHEILSILEHEILCKKIFDEYSPEEMCTMDNFIKYLDLQSEIYKLNNTHFLPQKYELLGRLATTPFLINESMVIEQFPNHVFTHVEDFGLKKEIESKTSSMKLGIDHVGNDDIIESDNVFLNNLTFKDFKLFLSLYQFNKICLDSHHHSNKILDITNKIEKQIFLLLEDEYRLYGYEIKGHFINKKITRSLI
jgi:hypothetical protein